ncbi:hypothetical protein MIND_00886100 [Mycena indigotica]|uniref:F-box domain-containing protein n=1 Tax=Mycena indigotica TaxID=2126181 RepID=A0A8H6SGY7_9AGAR|nr:uncharacterized protein MIND_00886100 [Mycena indigotica]KAF7299368.1 hypothetical protein MIND_00886100 [Mycena indigotica]
MVYTSPPEFHEMASKPSSTSTPTGMSLPNETWINILDYIYDTYTLKSILSASRHFRVLGLEIALRVLVWDTAEKTHSRLVSLLQNPEKRCIPRVISMKLGAVPSAADTISIYELRDSKLGQLPDLQEAVRLRSLGTLSNLRCLTIVGGSILTHFFDTFRQLRRLDRLRLQSCTVCVPHSDVEDLLYEPDLTITSLVLIDIVLCNPSSQVSSQLWHRVREFSVISSTETTAYAESQATLFLPHFPNLVRLQILGVTSDEIWIPTVAAPPILPLLQSFSGSWDMAMSILASGVHLDQVHLLDAISVKQAAQLIERLTATRTLQLVLDD